MPQANFFQRESDRPPLLDKSTAPNALVREGVSFASTVPANPGPYTVQSPYVGIPGNNISNPVTMAGFTQVTGAPSTGEFALDYASGIFTFNAAQQTDPFTATFNVLPLQAARSIGEQGFLDAVNAIPTNPRTFTGAVPGSGPFTVDVDGFIPGDINTNPVTITGPAKTQVAGAPSADQFSVDYATGVFTFHSTDASDAFTASYRSTVDPAPAAFTSINTKAGTKNRLFGTRVRPANTNFNRLFDQMP